MSFCQDCLAPHSPLMGFPHSSVCRVSLVVPVESELRTVPPLDLDDLPDKLDDNAVYYIVDNNRYIITPSL